jgi:hypothetical protein
MPWSRAKREIQWQEWERDSPFGNFTLNDLFNACFRIQREASEAAGRHIPLVVENVVGAQRWVGRAAWHHGSFYLWGDVPALMPHVFKFLKQPGRNFHFPEKYGISGPCFRGADHETSVREALALKTVGHTNIRDEYGHTRHLTSQSESEGVKQGGSGPEWFDKALDERRKEAGTKAGGSHSDSRKAASAMIAKIPFELASYVARYYKPCPIDSENSRRGAIREI